MSNKIKTILDSIKEIEQVKLKPYFYSRLSSKLHKIYEKESFYLKYERPALVFSVVLLLLLNLFFITFLINLTVLSVLPSSTKIISKLR